MPRPRAPASAADFVAAQLAAQGISADQVDPDYISHLQHLHHFHPDGDSSALQRAAHGRPDSPPLDIKCEQPDDGEARSFPIPSPAPEGSDSPVEEKKPPAEIPWYETGDMDENYRRLWRHACEVDDTLVLEIDGVVVRYGQVDKAAGAEKKDGEEAAARAASGENGGGFGEKEKGKRRVGRPALKARVRDSPAHWHKGHKVKKGGENGGKKVKVKVKEAEEEEDQGGGKNRAKKIKSRVRDSRAHRQKGQKEKKGEQNGSKKIKVEEEEDQGAGGKNRAKKIKPRVRDSPAHRQESQGEKDGGENGAKKIKVEEEEHDEEEDQDAGGKIRAEKIKSRVRDSPAHRQKGEKDGGQNGAKKIKVEEEEEKPLKKLPVETLNTMNRETNSSDGNDTEPHIASGLHAVVWPTHIMERPDSEFKEMLMRVLRKPFSQGEYDRLLAHATIRLPATKKRQTRSGVKYYDSTHERIQSYFDSHPDLAKQVGSTSKPNQLALLRGFFFWLKNITNEDQFRPWRDDFRHYKLIPSME